MLWVSDLAASLGCQFTDSGTVDTDEHEATNVPGLYVAGDASRDVQFAIVAAAEGAEAVAAINHGVASTRTCVSDCGYAWRSVSL